MDGSENTFPMDITDPSSRPWNFRPQGQCPREESDLQPRRSRWDLVHGMRTSSSKRMLLVLLIRDLTPCRLHAGSLRPP
jgi:hypothetical protein